MLGEKRDQYLLVSFLWIQTQKRIAFSPDGSNYHVVRTAGKWITNID